MEERQTDARLFTTLFERYKEPFTLFAHSYLRDMPSSEDIYEEAMLQYWERRHLLPPSTNIPAYILTSIKNKALNHLRHHNIRMDAEEQMLDHHTRELNFRIASLEACDPQQLFAEEIQKLVREALEKLPEQSRLIFYKSRFEDKTNPQIAEELGIHVKTVEYHITKTLKILRANLKDYLPLLFLIYPRIFN